MKHSLALLIALAACGSKSERVDSTDAALPAIDTLKPVTTSDTLVTAGDTTAATAGVTRSRGQTPTPTPTQTKLGRDSAFPPPRGLPKLDTVPTKRPRPTRH